jgi:NitT/TauT family transport system substrate-binding protein
VNLGQAQIISAIASNNGDLARGLLCSGHDAGVVVPGALVARTDFAREKPELVAKYLAVYLRAWAWIKAHPMEARQMLRAFCAPGGVEISDQGIGAEFTDRPGFPLDEQIANMHRLPGKSKLDTWLNNIAEFMNAVGTILEPRPSPISATPM